MGMKKKGLEILAKIASNAAKRAEHPSGAATSQNVR